MPNFTNRSAREFWEVEPLRGEVIASARNAMLEISRVAFGKDWIDAAVIVALQKHQQTIKERLVGLNEVRRSFVFVTQISSDLSGISYVTDDGARANLFCLTVEADPILLQLWGNGKREIITCDGV